VKRAELTPVLSTGIRAFAQNSVEPKCVIRQRDQPSGEDL
jgi:hypothetical protein